MDKGNITSFEGGLNNGMEFDLSKISSCERTLTSCEQECSKYYSCDMVALANDILLQFEQDELLTNLEKEK